MDTEDIFFHWDEVDCHEEFEQLFRECFNTGSREGLLKKKSYGWRSEREYLLATARNRSGKLVGALAFYPRRFRKDEKVLNGLEVADVMVSPHYRGHSIFSKLIRLALSRLHSLQSFDFLLGFPNPAALPGWEKCEVGPIEDCQSFFVPLAAGNALARKRPKLHFLKGTTNAISSLINAIRPMNPKDSFLEVRPMFAKSARGLPHHNSNLFFTELTDAERSQRYAYGQAIGINTNYIIAEVAINGERALAAIIGLHDGRNARIYELICPDLDKITPALSCLRRNISKAMRNLNGTELEQISLDLPVAPDFFTELIRKAGFWKRTPTAKVFFHPLSPAAQKHIHDNRDLVCQIGDSDAP